MAFKSRQAEFDDLLARGLEQLHNDDLRAAVSSFEQATRIQPESADAWAYLAIARGRLGRTAAAAAAAERAVALEPDHTLAVAVHGYCLTRDAKFDAAARALTKASQLAPDVPSTYVNAAVALQRTGKIRPALELIDQALARGVADHRVLLLKGVLHMEEGELDAAVDSFERALATQPEDPEAGEGRLWAMRLRDGRKAGAATGRCDARDHGCRCTSPQGWLLIDDEQPAAALKVFSHVLRANKDDPAAMHGRIAALRLLGRLDQADKAIRIALRRLPDLPALRNECGWLRLDQGRSEEALAAFEAALAREERNEFALLGKARALRLLRRPAVAAEVLDAMPEPQRATARYQAERAFVALALFDAGAGGRTELLDALNALDGWLQHEPDDPIAHAACGIANWRLGRPRKAVACLERALERGPRHARAAHIRVLLGDLHHELGDLRRARAQYEQALAADPANACVEFKLAQLLDVAGERSLAIEHFKVAADQGDPYSHLWLASFLAGDGHYDSARDHWTAARIALERKRLDAAGLDAGDSFQLACVLYFVDGDLERTDLVAGEGVAAARETDRLRAELLALLAAVHLERASAREPGRPEMHRQKAVEAYGRAVAGFAPLAGGGDVQSLVRLAELHLAMEGHGEARRCLVEAIQRDPENSAAHGAMGTLHSRLGGHARAVDSLREAVRRDGHDLTLRSQLATALMRAGSTQQAEGEFRRVLSVTQEHIESLVGLGELYSQLGDEDDDPDYYEQAVDRLSEALQLARSHRGSKRLRASELADILYARGYARVRLYESSTLGHHEEQLRKAEKDFDECVTLDRGQHMGARARTKIRKRLHRLSSTALAERVGPLVVAALAFVVFAFTQSSLISRWPMARVTDGLYATLSFGALLFVVAGVSLPRLLRLKIAGMELEKSAVERAPAPTPLGIHVQAMRPPSPQSALVQLHHGQALRRVEPSLAPWMSRAAQPAVPELSAPSRPPRSRAGDDGEAAAA